MIFALQKKYFHVFIETMMFCYQPVVKSWSLEFILENSGTGTCAG